MNSNLYDVQVGQVWKDNDPRRNRTLIVREVGTEYAYCFCKEKGRTTRIRLDRFNENRQTGYTKVSDNE